MSTSKILASFLLVAGAIALTPMNLDACSSGPGCGKGQPQKKTGGSVHDVLKNTITSVANKNNISLTPEQTTTLANDIANKNNLNNINDLKDYNNVANDIAVGVGIENNPTITTDISSQLQQEQSQTTTTTVDTSDELTVDTRDELTVDASDNSKTTNRILYVNRGVVQHNPIHSNPCTSFSGSVNVDALVAGVSAGYTNTDDECMRGIAEQQQALGHKDLLEYRQMVASVADYYKYKPMAALSITRSEGDSTLFKDTFCDAVDYGVMNYYEDISEKKAHYLQNFWQTYQGKQCSATDNNGSVSEISAQKGRLSTLTVVKTQPASTQPKEAPKNKAGRELVLPGF